MTIADHYFAASRAARSRAEWWREQGDYTGAAEEARAEARHHIKMRETARDYAKQANAVAGAFDPNRVVTHAEVTDGPGLREDGHIIACGNGGGDDEDCSPECMHERRVWWAEHERKAVKP